MTRSKTKKQLSITSRAKYLRREYGDPRKVKRAERNIYSETDYAYLRGQWAAEFACKQAPRPNPYPPGKRHDAYALGSRQADPLGDHHGGNI